MTQSSQVAFYQPSGLSHLPAMVVAFAIGILIAITTAFIYNFLIVIMPFVYINLFITIGFGITLGYISKFLCRLGKVRNTQHQLYMASVVGLAAFYSQWIAYFVFLVNGKFSFHAYQESFAFFYNPRIFFSMLLELNQGGAWSMFGVMFTDFPLWIIWSLEAFLIVGIPVIIIIKHPKIPFSEKLNRWYPKYTLDYQFNNISTQNQFKKDLAENPEQAIKRLSYGHANRYSEVSIYFIKDEEYQYLSINNLFIANNGRGKKNISPVVHLLRISTEVAEELLTKFGRKKILDFYS